MTREVIPPGQVLVFDNWLESRTCSILKEELAFSWWQSSEIAFKDESGRQQSRLSSLRLSLTAGEDWMVPALRRRLRRIERRLERQFGICPGLLEPWQAVRYRRGNYFEEHHDAGMFAASPEGERTLSLVLYLDDHERGGATVFPALGLRIRPAAGTLAIWRNLLEDGSPDQKMAHAGLPPRRCKTILTNWLRERTFRHLCERREFHAEA